jgi:DNA polymerase I
MRTLLIDGDVFIYQFACSAEVATHWGDDFWTLHADAKVAKQKLDAFLAELKDKLEADRFIIAMSDRTRNYFRKQILPTYKANRDKVRKPVILNELRAYVEEAYECFERPTLEGDDVLGILATSTKIIKGEKVIVTIDKDLKTIPGLHYNTNKPELGIYAITEEEADYWHLFQTLTGDPSDGYLGCPGVGPKKAEELLAQSATWETVEKAFEKAGLGKVESLVQGQMSRILRAIDYDFKNRKTLINLENLR